MSGLGQLQTTEDFLLHSARKSKGPCLFAEALVQGVGCCICLVQFRVQSSYRFTYLPPRSISTCTCGATASAFCS